MRCTSASRASRPSDDPTRHFGCPEGKRLLGEDPLVSYWPQYFELDPVWEASRRLQRSQQPSTMAAEPEKPPVADAPGSGDLPGDLDWPKIEDAYRELATNERHVRPLPGKGPWRRRRPNEPSRPEVAAELGTSPATLKRACDAAEKGTRWPPAGL